LRRKGVSSRDPNKRKEKRGCQPEPVRKGQGKGKLYKHRCQIYINIANNGDLSAEIWRYCLCGGKAKQHRTERRLSPLTRLRYIRVINGTVSVTRYLFKVVIEPLSTYRYLVSHICVGPNLYARAREHCMSHNYRPTEKLAEPVNARERYHDVLLRHWHAKRRLS